MLSTDPIDFLRDQDDEIVRPPVLSTGLVGISQVLRMKVRRVMGEWAFNREKGVAYLENDIVATETALLGQKFDTQKIRAELEREILDTFAVDSVTRMAITMDTGSRKVSVDAQIKVVFDDLAETLDFTEII